MAIPIEEMNMQHHIEIEKEINPLYETTIGSMTIGVKHNKIVVWRLLWGSSVWSKLPNRIDDIIDEIV